MDKKRAQGEMMTGVVLDLSGTEEGGFPYGQRQYNGGGREKRKLKRGARWKKTEPTNSTGGD